MTNKRMLPKNVDGRLKIGPFTFWNFLKWVWIPILLVIFFLNNVSQGSFIFTMFAVALSSIPFMEFKHKQTGTEFFKELIIYDLRAILADFFPKIFKHKEIYFERSEFDVSFLNKFTFNEKVYKIKQERKEKNTEQ